MAAKTRIGTLPLFAILVVAALALVPLLHNCGGGIDTKLPLGLDYPDKVITRQMIVNACERLRKLLDSGATFTAYFVVWDPGANLGFGQHAAVQLECGSDATREAFILDVGRRPEAVKTPAISVLRIFDHAVFVRYTGDGTPRRLGISNLVPNVSARKLAYAVLDDLAGFLSSPNAEPAAWKFHILINNCARYAQKRIGESVKNGNLRTRVLTFREGALISPTELSGHLERCDFTASSMSGGPQLQITPQVSGEFRRLPADEQLEWKEFFKANTSLEPLELQRLLGGDRPN